MDISPSIGDLRARLSVKWRHALSHAERQTFSTEIDWQARTSSDFIEHYEKAKEVKHYTGATGDMLRALIKFMAPRKEVLILNALCGNKKVASVLILLHGTCATYQASWSDEQGRKFNCHNRLLWQAIEQLKARGIASLDLGGVNRVSAKGVTRFKEGMGGTTIQLCGHFQ